MVKVHLDTDFGGDIDDLCALALLLRWSGDVQITGITTVGDIHGKRAGYVRYVLGLEGRNEIPVKAGVEASQEFYRYELSLPPEDRYWPEPVAPSPNAPDEAIQLLKVSIEQGAIIIGIGPYSNLYLLDLQYPGILMHARLFLMGGYVFPPRPGFPNWGNDIDFNVQADVRSAKHVLQNSNPTLIPLSMTIETALRRAHLDALSKSGRLGQLIARQAEAFAADEKFATRFAPSFPELPQDIINFQHDPLACAVALGWHDGVETQELPLIVEEKDGWLTESVHPSGRLARIVTKVDGPRFNQYWIDTIARVGRTFRG